MHMKNSVVHPVVTLLIWMTVFLPVWVVIGKTIASPMQDIAVANDPAVIELSTLRAAAGNQLLGPYSRFRIHHPGPMMFYALAPFYQLGNRSHLALCAGALVWNCIWLVAIAFLIFRMAGAVASWIASVLISLYLLFLGPTFMWSVWNPDVALLPFAAALLAVFAVGSGHIRFLVLAVVAGSFAVQSHLVYFVPLAAITAATGAVLVFSGRDGEPGIQRRRRWVVVASLIVGLFLWSLPLVEEVLHSPGNLTQLLQYSTTPKTSHHVGEALASVSLWWSSYLLSPFGARAVSAIQGGLKPWLHLLTAVQVLAMASLAWWGIRRRARSAVTYLLLGAAGLVSALVVVSSIEGALHAHLVRWVSAVGLFSLLMACCVVCRNEKPLFNARTRLRSGAVAGISFAIIVPIAGAGAVAAWNMKSLAHFVDAAWGPAAYGQMWPDVQDAIIDLGITRPHVRILENRVWPVGAALVLQLTKSDFNLSVDPRWWFMFGDLPEAGESDGIVLVGTSGGFDDLLGSPLHHSRLIRSPTTDVLVSDAPQRPIEGELFFAEKTVELFLRDGFSKPSGDPGSGFRSSTETTSLIVFPLANSRQYQLTLEVAPYPVSDQIQTIEIHIDGKTMGVFTLSDEDWSRVTCRLPVRSGDSNSAILIRYGHTEMLPLSRNSRRQMHRAVRFRSLRVDPVGAPH